MSYHQICHYIDIFTSFLIYAVHVIILFFFFNDTATTEIYTLSLHDALPISPPRIQAAPMAPRRAPQPPRRRRALTRSEEHTSELQSLAYLVCRLLLEKKKKK